MVEVEMWFGRGCGGVMSRTSVGVWRARFGEINTRGLVGVLVEPGVEEKEKPDQRRREFRRCKRAVLERRQRLANRNWAGDEAERMSRACYWSSARAEGGRGMGLGDAGCWCLLVAATTGNSQK